MNKSPRSVKSPTQLRLEARRQKDATAIAQEVENKLENANVNRREIINARKAAAGLFVTKAKDVAEGIKKADAENAAELASALTTKMDRALTKRQARNARMKSRAAQHAARAKEVAAKVAEEKSQKAVATKEQVDTAMSAAEERRKAMTAAVVQKCGATYQSAKDISATMKVAQEDTGHILRESMEQRLDQASERRRMAVEEVQMTAASEVIKAKETALRVQEAKKSQEAELKARLTADQEAADARRQEYMESRRKSRSPATSPNKQ